MARTHVPNSGPLDAPVLWVGEAPGRTEEQKGAPFVGATGMRVRRLLRDVGVDTDAQVRWANVCPTNPGTLPSNPGLLRGWVRKNWHHLDEDLTTMTPKVVVACGRAALYRLTGRERILVEHGSVWAAEQLPEEVAAHPVLLPPGCVVIACLHPASVMRSKIGARWLQVGKAAERVAHWMNRTAEGPLPTEIPVRHPSPGELDELLTGADELAIDTEFDVETQRPYHVGMSVDGEEVLVWRPALDVSGGVDAEYRAVMRKHMMRRDLTKIAHYHAADTGALATLGIDTCAPWYDTIEAFSALYPDLPSGLGHAALFYFDDWNNWKWMEHDDEQYNALDVIATWRIKQHTRMELEEAGEGMLRTFERERMPVSAVMALMEDRGLQVDERRRAAEVRQNAEREAKLTAEIKQLVDETFAGRARKEQEALGALEDEIRVVEDGHAVAQVRRCAVKGHGDYVGLRAKRWARDDGCACRAIYDGAAQVRARLDAIKRKRVPHRARAKRWDTFGFDPGNSEHMRWLLYDRAAFGLPVQRDKGRVTANATALEKLLNLAKVRAKGERVTRTLAGAKEVRTLRKWRATFLFEGKEGRRRVDSFDVAHPPMRAFGSGTGRPAGGADDATGDRRPSPYSYNVLNIPEECRVVYVPHAEENLVVRRTLAEREVRGETAEDDEVM